MGVSVVLMVVWDGRSGRSRRRCTGGMRCVVIPTPWLVKKRRLPEPPPPPCVDMWQARMAYHHAMLELDHRNAARDKLFGQPGKEEKAAQAEASAQKAQAHADEAKREFDLISERFLREFERYGGERAGRVGLLQGARF
jgi:hypothetical protein